MSDWELADAFNAATGGFRSAPLPEKLSEKAYAYAAMQRREERKLSRVLDAPGRRAGA